MRVMNVQSIRCVACPGSCSECMQGRGFCDVVDGGGNTARTTSEAVRAGRDWGF